METFQDRGVDTVPSISDRIRNPDEKETSCSRKMKMGPNYRYDGADGSIYCQGSFE